MKLTRLRLAGFKSFVEPTDFLIEPGLTGVVGPNGCGKSNLVEALRWVMGESSYKSMRASGMDDVIFAGSGNAPGPQHRRGRADVDNRRPHRARRLQRRRPCSKFTRRIEREEGSTYRVNGKEVRARDVQLLFADAATGARSPAHGAPGPDRRDHRGQAAGPPPHPRGRRRHRRAALPAGTRRNCGSRRPRTT